MGLLKQRGEYLLYLRKSRSDSPEASVEEVLAKHEKMLQDYFLREFGYKIPEENIYREIVSGGESIEERPEMCKVMARIEDSNVSGVAVADPQRLSRGSLTDCDLLIDKFRFTQTLVVTPAMVYDLENKMERRFFQDELMRGRDYLEYVKEALQRGRTQSAMRGNVVGSPPYGYNKIKIGKDWTLEPNEKADIVRMIFEWYSSGSKTPGKIADELNKMQIPSSTGKLWAKEMILNMLKNVQYNGKVIYGRRRKVVVFENGKKVKRLKKQPAEDVIIVNGKHQAIIDDKTFELTQERIAGRAYIAPRTRAPISDIFAGLLRCPICGYSMSLHKRKYGDFHNCRFYCSKTPLHKDLVAGVRYALQMEHLPDLQAKLKSGDGDAAKIQQKLLNALEKQMAEYKAQEAKQYDLLETGIYTNDVFVVRNNALREKMALCAGQIAEARKNMPAEIDYEEKIVTLKEAIAALGDESIPVEQTNRLLKAIIKEIKYTSPKGQPYGINDYTLEITLNI